MIALLLGSFNPIHRGHIAIAQYTLKRDLADEVWFVVSPQNPLKQTSELAPFEDRLEMAKLAIEANDKMKVCDIEAVLPYPSYTINTIRELYRLYPDKKFFVLAGSDIKEQLPRWKEYQEVQRLVKFMIYPRGEEHENCSPEMRDAPMIDIDSTRCRQSMYPPSEYVIESLQSEVIDYIHSKNLYPVHDIEYYDELIKNEPHNAANYYERGMFNYRCGAFGNALNDFADAVRIDPSYKEAAQMKTMTESILSFRYSDIYNP